MSRSRIGMGSKGSIRVQCLSVNSFCRCLMAKAQQFNHLTRKYLI